MRTKAFWRKYRTKWAWAKRHDSARPSVKDRVEILGARVHLQPVRDFLRRYEAAQ